MASNVGKKYILLISAGGSILAPFMVSSLIVAIPTIGREFSMKASEMSVLATAFFLAASMFLVPFGRLADIYGVKKIFGFGICLYFVSALLAALAPSSLVLIFARFLTGVGAAMIFGTSFALLSLSLPENERGKALGINIAASLVGFSIGFQVGGLLTYYASWRDIFMLTLPVDLLVLALIKWKLPGECAFSRGQKFDLVGSILVAVMLFLLIAGFSVLPSPIGALSLLSGLALFIVFIWWEMKTASPIIDPRLFAGNRPFTQSNGAVLIYNAGSFAVIFLFSLYLQYIRGFDAREVGLVLLASTLIMAGIVSYAGRLSDRIRPDLISSAGALVTLLGVLPMIFLSSATRLEAVMVEFLLLLVGGALFAPPMVKIILSCISRKMYGVGSSLEETMRLLGNTVSMAITTVVFARYLSGENITPEHYPALLGSMRTIFIIFFALLVFSFILTATAGRRERGRSDEKLDLEAH